LPKTTQIELLEDSYGDGKTEFTGAVIYLKHPAAAWRALVVRIESYSQKQRKLVNGLATLRHVRGHGQRERSTST